MYVTEITRIASQNGYYNGKQIVVPVKRLETKSETELDFNSIFEIELARKEQEWQREYLH